MMYQSCGTRKMVILVVCLAITIDWQGSQSFNYNRKYSPFLGYFVLPFDLPTEFTGPLYGIKDFMPSDSTNEYDANG